MEVAGGVEEGASSEVDFEEAEVVVEKEVGAAAELKQRVKTGDREGKVARSAEGRTSSHADSLPSFLLSALRLALVRSGSNLPLVIPCASSSMSVAWFCDAIIAYPAKTREADVKANERRREGRAETAEEGEGGGGGGRVETVRRVRRVDRESMVRGRARAVNMGNKEMLVVWEEVGERRVPAKVEAISFSW